MKKYRQLTQKWEIFNNNYNILEGKFLNSYKAKL